MRLLEKINIYGLNEIEDVVFAGLVTGDPILLVGRHGSAKTFLVKRLAECLGLKFIAYDASKSLFDDVVGFPDPHSLAQGKLEYIPTPISIWDKEFVLVDELSRATPSMQNKWLEIIRSRRLMGRKIPYLKYVFAAMNPPGSYPGAMDLDPALSGRFSFVIFMPEITQIAATAVFSIIANVSEDDAVAMSREQVGRLLDIPESVKSELKDIIVSARQKFTEIQRKFEQYITDYIIRLLELFAVNKNKIVLDGRRLGMLRRNCIAYLAVKMVKNGLEDVKNNYGEYFFTCLRYSLPYSVEGSEISDSTLRVIHLQALKKKSMDVESKIINSETLTKMVDTYLKYFSSLPSISHLRVVEKILRTWKEVSDSDGLLDAYQAILKLLKFYQREGSKCPIDARRRIAEFYYWRLSAICPSITPLESYRNSYIPFDTLFEGTKITGANDIVLRLLLNFRDSAKLDSREKITSLKEKIAKLLEGK